MNIEKHISDIQHDLDTQREARNKIKREKREWTAFKKLPSQTRMEFWCDRCHVDFVAPAYKIWSYYHEQGSWHSVCPLCELLVYRHITAKTLDPYYEKSTKIRIMRGEGVKDMIQPNQYGFQTLYGDPFEHYYRRFQERDEDIVNRYAAYGLTGLTLGEKTEREQIQDVL